MLVIEKHFTLSRAEGGVDAAFSLEPQEMKQLVKEVNAAYEAIGTVHYGLTSQESTKFRRSLYIVEDMKELCPDAWLINFTNPSGMVTEAVMRYGKWNKIIGLCNVPVGAMMKEPKMINKTLDELTYKFAGLNHFHWHKVYDEHGNEVTQQIIDAMYEGKDGGIPANIHDIPFFKEQLDTMHSTS